jgi:hypothetical protein
VRQPTGKSVKCALKNPNTAEKSKVDYSSNLLVSNITFVEFSLRQGDHGQPPRWHSPRKTARDARIILKSEEVTITVALGTEDRRPRGIGNEDGVCQQDLSKLQLLIVWSKKSRNAKYKKRA